MPRHMASVCFPPTKASGDTLMNRYPPHISIQMRLYYLTEERWAKKIILERRFKLSTFDELNDPFELLGASIGEKLARKLFKVLFVHWTKTIGLLCTGVSWTSPVMWAHYGHKHTGVCLGFDVAEGGHLLPVKYEAERLTGLLDGLGRGRMTLDELTAVLTTKFKDWEYEHEWRLFARLDERAPEDGKYYLNFDPSITLREVILGARCAASVGDFAALIKAPKQSVKVLKARAAFDSFSMVRQKQVKIVTVRASKP